MKKTGKTALVSALALTVAISCSAAAMALENPYEKAAEDYAQSIENLVETTGDKYEKITEAYPDSAINNPSAPVEYVKTSVKLGCDYMSKLSGLTNGFLNRIR